MPDNKKYTENQINAAEHFKKARGSYPPWYTPEKSAREKYSELIYPARNRYIQNQATPEDVELLKKAGIIKESQNRPSEVLKELKAKMGLERFKTTGSIEEKEPGEVVQFGNIKMLVDKQTGIAKPIQITEAAWMEQARGLDRLTKKPKTYRKALSEELKILRQSGYYDIRINPDTNKPEIFNIDAGEYEEIPWEVYNEKLLANELSKKEKAFARKETVSIKKAEILKAYGGKEQLRSQYNKMIENMRNNGLTDIQIRQLIERELKKTGLEPGDLD